MSLLFPTDQPNRLIRLKRFYMGVATYVLSAIVYAVLLSLKPALLSALDMVPLLIGIGATQAYFFWQLRFGDTEAHSDPSMALAQIIVGMTWHLFVIIASPDLRSILLLGYVMPMMFGVLALGPGSLAIAAAYALITYSAVALTDLFFLPERFDGIAEASRLLALGAMLAWGVLFGGYISSLRNTLSRRNHELREALIGIQQLSTRDDLTAAYNRRYMMEALSKEKARYDRGGSPFAVILMDLDHFKSINDQYGHLAGDRVLVTFCERVTNTLRSIDLMESAASSELARCGGEEFVVLLPDTDLAGALECAERICRVTRTEPMDGVFNITVSCGVASYSRHEPVESLLQRADRALYEAKDKGRDRVVTLDILPPKRCQPQRHDAVPTASNVVVGQFGAPSKERR